ncbi:MAG: hypothetical protein RH917_20845 [Lacipirellulaceae bacterium]
MNCKLSIGHDTMRKHSYQQICPRNPKELQIIDSIPEDELSAWYQAGIATMAVRNRIEVHQLTLEESTGKRAGVRVEAFPASRILNLREGELRTSRIEDYVSTLLAGTVGRLIRIMLSYDGNREGHSTKHPAMRCWETTLEAQEPETDRAYAITVGYLQEKDGGDPTETLQRLWLVVYGELQTPSCSRMLSLVAEKLLEKRKLSSSIIHRLLSD